MNVWEAIVLGIVQGLTEFLPVSSSGHIEIGTAIFGIQSEDNLLFSIVVHAATALSTIVIYRKDILQLIVELFKFQWNDSTKFVFQIALSIIPVGIVGVFFEDQVESFFGGRIMLVGSMLIVTAALLAFTHFKKNNEGELTFPKAFAVGIAQAIAILPGISRSGATISTGLLLGIKKDVVTRFSFLMVLVPILGAAFLKLLDFLKTPEIASQVSATALSLGFLAAFVSGMAACQWMISIVRKGKLIYFSVYCLIVGLIAIFVSL
ncbi:MAG: undecaprenyl-diphosphate phosphatase [Imperialibacter sp.]